MSDHVIERETSPTRGRLFIRKAGVEAELTWAVASPTRVIADHTGVPDAMRGAGVGQALVAQLVEDARKGGFRVVPLCPFVEVMRKRHPDWADAFTT